eukprot:scaffold136281_cov18-Tisochrysis_lutea.AAC.1
MTKCWEQRQTELNVPQHAPSVQVNEKHTHENIMWKDNFMRIEMDADMIESMTAYHAGEGMDTSALEMGAPAGP